MGPSDGRMFKWVGLIRGWVLWLIQRDPAGGWVLSVFLRVGRPHGANGGLQAEEQMQQAAKPYEGALSTPLGMNCHSWCQLHA